MKYNFELDLDTNNSLSIIIKNIKPNTTILEFGPANGRLTKYLKEQLNCEVYLVEIDEMAGKEALLYGKDIVIDDIETFTWMDKYSGIKFDHILFADVLEHLRNPQNVLKMAGNFLKEKGTVLLSVPNLAHNSVIISLLKNDFNYSQVGLLDNTHIHFFTKNSLESMINETGFYASKRMATYSKVGENEINVSVNMIDSIDPSFWNSRTYGEVYQYVYELKQLKELSEVEENNNISPITTFPYAQIYLGDDGYSEDKTIKKTMKYSAGKQKLEFSFMPNREIRFDPINDSAIVRIDLIYGIDENGNQVNIQIGNHNAYLYHEKYYVFTDRDPLMYISGSNKEKICKLVIEIEYLSMDGIHIREMSDVFGYEFKELKAELNTALEKTSEFDSLQHRYNELIREKVQLQEEKVQLQEEKVQLQEQRNGFENEIQDLIFEQNKKAEELRKWMEVSAAREEVIQAIYNSRSWKVTKIFRKIRRRR